MKARSQTPGRRGFTILELFVAISILVMMVAMVGSLLSSSQQLSREAQATMRANSAAGAVGEVIRQDLLSVTPHGFLCIADYNGPTLIFTTAGPMNSLTYTGTDDRERRSSAAVITFGMCDNQFMPDAAAGKPENDLLIRVAFLLSGGATSGDRLSATLARLGKYTREELGGPVTGTAIIDTLCAPTNIGTGNLTVPAMDLSQVGDLWRVLSAWCSDLSIKWTDGTSHATSHQLNWYGLSFNSTTKVTTIVAKDGNWGTKTVQNDTIEFRAPSGGYRALWTLDDPTNWPKAIMITFRIRDPEMPDTFQSQTYQVICPIGQ